MKTCDGLMMQDTCLFMSRYLYARIKSITKHQCISKFMYNIFSFLQWYHKTFKKQKLGKIQLWYLEFVHFAKFSLIDSFTRLLFLVSCSFGLQFFFLSSSGFSWIFLLFLQTKFLHWIPLHTGRFPSNFSNISTHCTK